MMLSSSCLAFATTNIARNPCRSFPLPASLEPSTLETFDPSVPVEQLTNTQTIVVFIIGIIPFLWASVEFWRRIAVGASFGTTKDSVVIPRPGDKIEDNQGNARTVLGQDALAVAYILFALAIGAVGLAVASVVTTGLPG